MEDLLKNLSRVLSVPYVSMHCRLTDAVSTLQVQNMKAVEHEDTELNRDYSVDPLADPRLDKMDLFNMVDTEDRDKIMNAQSSYQTGDLDEPDLFNSVPSASASESKPTSPVATPPVAGSGE